MKKVKNARSMPKVYYGLHMSEGVAEYADPGFDPYRILIAENTLKNMDPTYAGRPVYVEHVDEVDLDNIQEEADGYVVESFFNKVDGKHWAKFIIVSDRGQEHIRRGWRLSNSYTPTSFTKGGQWHGVEYAKEITAGEYDHLAIVPNPRYEESVIMTPEEFKRYNEEKQAELQRLTNSKERGEGKMKLNFFKRAKVDNSTELADTSVVLPKSGREMTIEKLVEMTDEILTKKKNSLADPSDKVKMHDGNMCNVGELVKKHKALHDELEEMKSKQNVEEKEGDAEVEEKDVEVEGDDKSVDNDDPSEADDEHAIEADKKNDDDDDEDDGEESMDNDEDEDAKKKALELAEHEEEEIVEAKKKKNASNEKKQNVEDIKKAAKKKADAKEKADRLRNANLNIFDQETAVVELMTDQVERGKTRYGSSN